MYFLYEVHHSLLALKHFSTMLRGHFKQKDYQQEAKSVKNMALTRPQKGELFTV